MEKKMDGEGVSGQNTNKASHQSSGDTTTIHTRKGVFGWVTGLGKAVNYGSRHIRLLQSGQTDAYFLLMVLGMLVLFAIWILF